MKKLLFLITCFSLSIQLSFTQTFTGAGGAIPDLGDAYFDINVTGLDGTDILVSVCINITHGYDQDLDIYLVDPLGNEHELSTDNGGSNNNYTNTCFTNTATINITAGAAPFTGNFIPECGLLPTGLYPNDLWRLHIYDDGFLDAGSLVNWSMTFTSPPCATVGFNSLPTTMNCNDAAVTMYANDSATANGAIYPTIVFQYDTDDYGSTENGCRIWESSTSSLLYENIAMDDNTVLTVYAVGPLFSPSETYTTEIFEGFGDGGIDLVVYDGNGTVYDTYPYPVGPTGWITRGPFVPAGLSSWSASGAGITATSDWGGAIFNPAVAGPGVHTITYCWDNQNGCSDCALQDVTVVNPWDASWTSPGTVCVSAGSFSLNSLITGSTGGTWTGTGVSAGNFNPAGLSGNISVTYTVGSSTTCRDIETQTITVIPLATVFAGSDAIICGVNTFTTNDATMGGSSTSLTWSSSGTGSFDDASSLNTTYTPDATDISNGSVTLTILTSGACESASDEIVLSLGTEYSFTELDTICLGDSLLWQGNYYYTSNTFQANYSTVLGCDSLYQLQLSLYDMPEITSVNTNDINDCEIPDGAITIQAIGGTPSYQYSIDNGSSFEDTPGFAGLISGTYYIVVIDQNGCKDYETAILIDIAGTQIDSILVSTLNCFNDGSGSIIIYSSDAINYSIDSAENFQSSPIFNNLNAGTYNLYIENNNNCRDSSLNLLITQPDSLVVSVIVDSGIDCSGETGNLSIIAIGGTPVYQYSIDNGSSFEDTPDFSDLISGTYNIVVVDQNGCTGYETASLSIVVGTQIDSIFVSTLNCYNDSSGSIIIYSSDAINYSIDSAQNFQSSPIFNNLVAGTYNLFIENDFFCRDSSLNLIITQPDSLVVSLIVDSEIECFGESGNLSIIVEGGTLPFSFLWTNSGTGTSEIFGPGAAGVSVSDNNACTAAANHVFGNPTEINVSTSVTNETCSGVEDGAIDLTASGGTGNLIFSWSVGSSDEDLQNIAAGTYFLSVSDENFCVKTDTIIVFSEGSSETCIIIPTAFTPNSDGKNDTWAIKNIGIVEELKIEIFNRWGQLIFSFEGSGTDYTDQSKQWDGTFNGSECPIGSYVFIVNMENDNEGRNGVVVIKR